MMDCTYFAVNKYKEGIHNSYDISSKSGCSAFGLEIPGIQGCNNPYWDNMLQKKTKQNKTKKKNKNGGENKG